MKSTVLSAINRSAGTQRVFLLILAAACALAAVACSSSEDVLPIDTSEGYRGTVLSNALPKPDFTLVDTSGAFYDFGTQTEGYVTLVYFGYTYCPDICPDHMANIAAVLKRLPDDVSEQVKVVFVTVDPDRDDSDRLREWLDLFDPSFVGLRGRQSDVDLALKKTLGELYFPITREDLGKGNYSVSHAAFVIAYTPDNMAHTVYPFGVRQDDYAHDLYKLVSEGWGQPTAVVEQPASSPEPSAGVSAPTASATAGQPVETPAGSVRGPRRLKPDEARKLLSAHFSAVTIDTVRQSIEGAFEKHPDASRFMSQGLILGREKLDLELRICGSRPEGGRRTRHSSPAPLWAAAPGPHTLRLLHAVRVRGILRGRSERV